MASALVGGPSVCAPTPYAPLLAGVSPATISQRRRAMVVDAAPLVGATLAAAGSAGRTDLLPWVMVIAVALLVQASLFVCSGRSVGRLLLGLRSVDDLTGLPATLRSLLPRLAASRHRRGLLTADLRAGRDPLDLVQTARAESMPRRARADPDGVLLVFDTGRRHVLTGSLVIGRSPDSTADTRRGADSVLGMADLSRTLAKTHARLDWSGSELWVSDLGSAHGSCLVTPDGERHRLAPGGRGRAGIGWTVSCGDRFFSVHALPPDGEG